MSNKFIAKKIWLALILVVIILSMGLSILYAGKFLVVDEKLKKSDVIIVLSGDKGTRLEKGVQLYQQGYGKYILITGGKVYEDVTMAQLMKEHAIKLGVPEKAIIIKDKADSTYENAIVSKELVNKQKFQSAIVVSSNYHMRRVKMLFEREYEDTNVTLTYIAVRDQEFDQNRWWSSNKSLMVTITEFIKLSGYDLGENS